MWLFTKKGFFSTVNDWHDENQVLIRARVKEDIDNMVELLKEHAGIHPEVIVTPQNDYLFRVHVPKTAYAKVAQKLIEDMDYSNFKDSVHGNRKRDAAYMRVWVAMSDLQDASNR